jgi:hypothetical protein
MDARMKRFDPPVQHLRKSGQVADGMDVDGSLVDRVQRAARRE